MYLKLDAGCELGYSAKDMCRNGVVVDSQTDVPEDFVISATAKRNVHTVTRNSVHRHLPVASTCVKEGKRKRT